MKKIKILSVLLSVLTLMGTATQLQALNLIHVLTLNLKLTLEGPTNVKGPLITVAPISIRNNTRDLIDAIASARGDADAHPKAQLLLVRYNVGEESETGAVVIRQPGVEDWNVDEYIRFTGGGIVYSGQEDQVTGRERSTLTYIGTLIVDLPDDIFMELSGITLEKRATLRVDGQEVVAGMNSQSSKLAGEGFGIVGSFMPVVIAEGTFTVGAAKVVPSL